MVLLVHRLGNPNVGERDLQLALVRVEDVYPECLVTSTHVSGSWFRWYQPGFFGVPSTPAISRSAGNVQVLRDPYLPATMLVLLQIVACALRSEFLAEPIKHRREVLLRQFRVLLPSGNDGRLEFLLAELLDFCGVHRTPPLPKCG